MWIVRLALRRPYTFVVAALVLLLLTPFVLVRTPTDIFPAIDVPVVSVVWVYKGLNAREFQQRILWQHQRMISTLVHDIAHTESTACDGAGVIKVYLQPGASVSEAVGQLAASGQTAVRLMPPGIHPPFIIRYNASTVPILQYSLASRKLPEQEIQDLAMNRIKVGLATVRGASVPYPYGGKARVVAVDLDLRALQARKLTPQDVVQAFNAQNFVLPGGTAKIGETEYNVSLNSNPAALAALNDLPVKTVNGAVIRVGDVAHVHDGYEPQQNVVRLNGVRGVLLTIYKSGAASTLRVVEGVRKAMPRILAGLPPELEAREFADQSLFVRAAVSGVVAEGLIAAGLTAVAIGLPAPFDIQIVGRDREKSRAVAHELVERIRRVPGAVDLRVQQPSDQPELHVAVDRTRAHPMGFSERDVADSVLVSLSGNSSVQPSYWLNPRNGIQYPVSIRTPEHPMDSLAALQAIPVSGGRPGKNDAQILANVASVERASGSPVYSHYDVMPVIDVFGGVDGRDLGGVLRDITPLVEQAKRDLPGGSFITLRGQADTMHRSYTGLAVGLAVAVALIYLLLVVNFQSWLDPFIIIAALPGALAGVVWGLHLSLTTLSVPALMGAVMSLGVATANSVLVVSFARTNMEKGLAPLAAAWEAGVGRLRPVLMTALAMMIGMLPMSLALGEGGEQNAPLARAVIGGLALATAATLFFVPAVFGLLHRQGPEALLREPLRSTDPDH